MKDEDQGSKIENTSEESPSDQIIPELMALLKASSDHEDFTDNLILEQKESFTTSDNQEIIYMLTEDDLDNNQDDRS